MELLVAPFELKSFNEQTGSFEGYGSYFSNIDHGRDVVLPGAFDRTIAEHKSAGTMPGMLWNHKVDEPVGEYKSWHQDKSGLLTGGELWTGKGIPRVEQTYMFLKSKSIKGMSMGYKTLDKNMRSDGVRELKSVSVKEISVLPFPMNERCTILSVKGISESDAPLTPREAEQLLRDACGFSSREAKSFLSRVYDGIADRDGQDEVIRSLRALSQTLKA